ncbi:hypothetical protein BDW71DRAFT_210574 [Aspergillus fruticulosus]
MSPLPAEYDEVLPNGTTVPLELGFEEDVEKELHHFVKLFRMGNYSEAQAFFDCTLGKHNKFFPAIAEYADMLLEQGRYGRAAEFLSDHLAALSGSSQINEIQLLRLMKSLADAYSKGALRSALVEAQQARELLALQNDGASGNLYDEVQASAENSAADNICEEVRKRLEAADQTWNMLLNEEDSLSLHLPLALERISLELVEAGLSSRPADSDSLSALSSLLTDADVRHDLRNQILARIHILVVSCGAVADWRDLYSIFELQIVDSGNIVDLRAYMGTAGGLDDRSATPISTSITKLPSGTR